MGGIDRRDLMKLAGLGGVVFASSLGALPAGDRTARAAEGGAQEDFFFVQLSDTHWGYSGPLNPDAHGTLRKAVAAVNSLDRQPDFIVFTGDLIHTTDDKRERRRRMAGFREIAADLKVKTVRFMAGEHDASLDRGAAYQEFFGNLNYTFDHKGVHFIVLDNASDPAGSVGGAQLAWLRADLAQLGNEAPIVVLAHRPLFDLYPQWDWTTRDGAAVIEALMPHENVTVFYGHIHQDHHHMTGHIAHHAARSLIFPQPAPGSLPRLAPVPWDPAAPYRGLGWRTVGARRDDARYTIAERPVVKT